MEPIAIIGMGCRFPGANNPELFWQILANGVDRITEVPPNRWSIDRLYNSEPGTPGKMNTRWGGFLEEIARFDANFFGISPREAERIDPQQRLLLEVTWEALENSGIVPKQLAGSNTGVFVGISNSDYGRLISKDITNLDAYSGTGTAFSIAANRISYTLDLHGPSLAISTACSSSLVAIHLACQSLRTRESSLCLVGGVNLIISPEATITFSQAHMMANDGRCKTFDASADGYVRGEGCGIVVLKPLEEAINDKNNILAVIRGSAVNQDGLTNGITAPNGPSQQKVIRQALHNAGVAPEEISYIEAHGTGTPLGDPVEVRSLKKVLMGNRQPKQTCWLGSVKTNIGHLESAAGIASLIKVVLALQHQKIPSHLHFAKLNPYISLEGTTFKIPTTCQTWESDNQKRLAGISGFGFGGTNCHLIVQEYNAPVEKEDKVPKPIPSHFLLPLSAKTEESLKALASKYLDFLATNSEIALSDICFTASTKRSHFPYRLAVIADSKQQLPEKFASFLRGETVVGLVTGKAKLRKKNKIAFLFTGQGSQYVGMGKQLYDTQPTFRRTLDQCNDILNSYLNIDLLKVIYSDNPSDLLIHETAYTQPALFALEYALAQLWISWGIEPAVVMGHSVGEYVAATIAGVFSLEDGLKLIAARGRLMQALPDNGVMFATKATESQAKKAIQGYESKVSIAAINGPQNIVISGEKESLEAVVNRLGTDGVKTKQLLVSHAFHSPLMEPMLTEFRQIADEINYHTPTIKVISNITGKEVIEEITRADYWCRHICQEVRFADSMQTLQEENYQLFLEVGPMPILLGMGRECINDLKALWLPSLRPRYMDEEQLLDSLGKLYVMGVNVNWIDFEQGDFLFHKYLQLPTYPFQRKRYWLEISNEITDKSLIAGVNKEIDESINLLKQNEIQKLSEQIEKVSNLPNNKLKLLAEVLSVIVQDDVKTDLEPQIRKNWLYKINWQEKSYQNQQLPKLQITKESSELCLIFADKSDRGKELAEVLETSGYQVILVYANENYRVLSEAISTINPGKLEQFENLLQKILTNYSQPITKIVYLWSLDTVISDELTTKTLEEAQVVGCQAVLNLIQSLSKVQHKQTELTKLWLVTRGAVAVNNTPSGIAQSPLWGMGKAVALEAPQLWGGIIDLTPETMPMKEEMVTIFSIIHDSEQEDALALRHNKIYVPRLMRYQLKKIQDLQINRQSSYLITGGLGALGFKIAQWLVKKGVRYLILTSRSRTSPKAQQAIFELEQQGVKVLVVQADVSNYGETAKIFQDIKTSFPPLRGIIHAAGVLDDGILLQQNWQRFSKVMAPKVQGTWNLHLLTQEEPLDFLILFSSVASLLGSPGQSNYAAANAFMDSLAYYRQTQGLPALSVNWGPWADSGMAAGLGLNNQQRLAQQGVNTIAPEQGLQILEQLLRENCSQIAVLPFDWSLFSKQFTLVNKPSLISELVAKVQLKEKTVEHIEQQESELLQRLKKHSNNNEQQEILISYLQSEIAKVMRLDQSQLPSIQQGFFDMGMDSLMIIELKNNLDKNLGYSLPATIALEAPSIKELADYIGENLLEWKLSTSNSIEINQNLNESNSNLFEIEKLNSEDLEILIAQEVADIEALLKEI